MLDFSEAKVQQLINLGYQYAKSTLLKIKSSLDNLYTM